MNVLSLPVSGTCNVLNGGCGEICVPEENSHRCECDVGFQLQLDQSCKSGEYLFFISIFCLLTSF